MFEFQHFMLNVLIQSFSYMALYCKLCHYGSIWDILDPPQCILWPVRFSGRLGTEIILQNLINGELWITPERKKKHVSFSHHSINDIHWLDSLYLLTAQRFFHIHDNLMSSVLLCVDPIIWSFILNSSSYKDHVVLQFQFCPLWQRAAPVYSHSAGRDSPRQPTIFLQFHIFSGSSHICLYKFLFVNIEMFF